MKIDPHCHTCYTRNPFGSNMRPENILKIAKKRRLDGIAITDDNTLRGYFKMKNAAKNDKDFIVIPGFEYVIKFFGIEIEEILVLGLDYIPRKKNLWDFIDEVRDNNGVCIIPHPFTLLPTIRYRRSLAELKMFDGIEVINSYDFTDYKKLAKNMAKFFRLGEIAGSDAHSLRNIGLAYTVCNDLINDIKKRRTKVVGIESPWTYKITNIFNV